MLINTSQIKEYLGCDDQFLVRLFDKFIEESGEGMQKMKDAMAVQNWPVVRGAAHKMLSSTHIFDIGELNELLEAIETMADEHRDLGQMPEKVQQLELSWSKVVEEIKALRPRLLS